MGIRELVIREKELKEKIQFNIEELDMLADLESLPKYRNSETLLERFNNIYVETDKLVNELNEISKEINKINNFFSYDITITNSEREILEFIAEKYESLIY